MPFPCIGISQTVGKSICREFLHYCGQSGLIINQAFMEFPYLISPWLLIKSREIRARSEIDIWPL